MGMACAERQMKQRLRECAPRSNSWRRRRHRVDVDHRVNSHFPVRLCNVYRLDDQHQLGRGLMCLAAAFVPLWLAHRVLRLRT